ncbi:MAG: diguanylate cyclase, partial [Acidobacteriota bacterium]
DTGNGLTSNLVRAVHLDQDGTAWIGTYGGGLYRLDGDHLSHFGKHNGLRENVVSMIVEDEFDRLWLTGNSGVTRVSKSELQRIADGLSDEVHSTLFGKSDGMLENECNGGSQPAGFLAADGHFWVPTIKGIAVVDTRADSVNPLPPPVHIKEVRIDGRPLDLSRPIDLPPGSRNLEISYTALSFVAPSKVRFKTRLTGIDEAWQDTGNRRVAYFPYVPPGRHQFQVIASNNDGVWNDTGVSFDFTVEPYFVQTPWFFGLVLLAVAAVVVAFMLTRQRALKRKELLLSRLVTDRTSELQRLAKLTERINSGFLLEEVLQHIFDACRPAIPYHRIGFAALTRDGKSVRARWVCSDSETMEIDRGYEAPLEGSSLARILETGNPRILDDLEAYLRDHPDSESTRRIVAEGMRSSLTCPLVAMGKPMGFLFFSSRRRAAFTDDHVKFFLQIGAHLSLAIEKSRLYSDLLNTRERLEEANRALEIQASRDGLTGLANRRTLDRQINLEWNRAIRSRTHLSLMMIDIDHFKLFNDTYGHLQGDDCLKKVADEIQRAFHRAGECAARYGGEEFAVVLPEATAAEACQAAAYLLKSIDNLGLQHETSPVGPNVTISIGIATALPKSTAPIQNLIAEADNALYRAKRDGRHGWVHATADGDV